MAQIVNLEDNYPYRIKNNQQVYDHPIKRSRDKLHGSHGEWYRPGTDNLIYEKALEACRASNASLAKCLSPDDALLLCGKVDRFGTGGFDAIAVRTFIEKNARDSADKIERSKGKWLSDATNIFAKVASGVGELADLLIPQSPDFTIPYGCLMIIFKTIVAKQEKQEKVAEIFETLLQKLPSIGLCDVVFPTDKMKEQLAKTYIDIMDLIVRATEYCAIGRISKIVDILTFKTKYDFDVGLRKIEESYQVLKDLTRVASHAMLKDTHDLLKDQSVVVDYVAEQSLSMVSNISALNQAIDLLQTNYSKIHLVQIRNWGDALIDELLPDTNTTLEELKLWQHREFRLSPKDHWEVNGMLDYLQEWNELESASILAIFGPSGDRDTWVTEFSLDMIQAFQVQDLLVTSALCDRPGDQHWTPTIVIKKLICQLLEQRPMLIVDAPEIFNARLFQKVTHFDQACRVFGLAVARLDSIAIIVDRVDRCQRDLNDTSSQDLVGFLLRLIKKYPKKVRVVLTSAEEPPDDLSPDLAVSICMISTKRSASRESYEALRRDRAKFDVTYSDSNGNSRHVILFGAENLYKLRESLRNAPSWTIEHPNVLKPRTGREKMIYREMGLPIE